MNSSQCEMCMVAILMILIRLQEYTASMVVVVLTACLMGTHQMYKYLKQEKSCDGSRSSNS